MIPAIFNKVGMTGFEPATTRPPDVYATGLRYIPNLFGIVLSKSLDIPNNKKCLSLL